MSKKIYPLDLFQRPKKGCPIRWGYFHILHSHYRSGGHQADSLSSLGLPPWIRDAEVRFLWGVHAHFHNGIASLRFLRFKEAVLVRIVIRVIPGLFLWSLLHQLKIRSLKWFLDVHWRGKIHFSNFVKRLFDFLNETIRALIFYSTTFTCLVNDSEYAQEITLY